MKSGIPFPKRDPNSAKPSNRMSLAAGRKFPIQKKDSERWRLTQTVRAGHVRGGHGFH